MHISAKPFKGRGGTSVIEIVEDYDGDTCRAVYTVASFASSPPLATMWSFRLEVTAARIGAGSFMLLKKRTK